MNIKTIIAVLLLVSVDSYAGSFREYCKASITDIKTSMKGLTSFLITESESIDQGNRFMIHEETPTRTTTIIFSKETGKGVITIMDETQVIASGILECHTNKF